MEDEVLLIDLRSPDKNMQIQFASVTDISASSNSVRYKAYSSPY